MPKDTAAADLIGAEIIGGVIALTFGGISYQQASWYFKNYPRDGWQFRFMVGLLQLLNFAHSTTVAGSIYDLGVEQWGSESGSIPSSRSFAVSFFFSSTIVTATMLFYSYRIHAMTRNYFVPGIVVLGAIVQFCACTMTGIIMSETNQTSYPTNSKMLPIAILSSSASAVVDTVIAMTISFRILQSRNSTLEVEKTVRGIAVLTIQTNAATTVLIMTTLALFASHVIRWSNSLYWICVKMYIISILAILNARPRASDMDTTHAVWTTTVPALFPDNHDTFTENELVVIHHSEPS